MNYLLFDFPLLRAAALLLPTALLFDFERGLESDLAAILSMLPGRAVSFALFLAAS